MPLPYSSMVVSTTSLGTWVRESDDVGASEKGYMDNAEEMIELDVWNYLILWVVVKGGDDDMLGVAEQQECGSTRKLEAGSFTSREGEVPEITNFGKVWYKVGTQVNTSTFMLCRS